MAKQLAEATHDDDLLRDVRAGMAALGDAGEPDRVP